ncbi:MAG: tRNA pseudouridine(55) synthase TruB [Candidatus Binatia bacterium]
MNGILLVDKPEMVSSAGVIRMLKPLLGRAKVGHLGTLDPFASGLLPLCLGEATKVARYLLLERKAYAGTIRLGVATDSLDRTGVPVAEAPVPALDPAQVEALAARLVGPQRQVPPMHSALKRGGVPLYKLARRGIEVERAPRDIEIYDLTLQLVAPDRVDFAVACSKGTYVRVLAADLGQLLGTVAHLERLRRTAVGAFRVESAWSVERLVAADPARPLPLIAVREALPGMVAHTATGVVVARLRRGQQQALAELPRPACSGETALVLAPSGEVAAVIEATSPVGWRLVRLLGAGA